MDKIKILKAVSVINRDNGERFACSDRLDAISTLLWNSNYRRINADGLFHLYSKKPLSDLPESFVVISCHIDCSFGITKCFAEDLGNGMLKGTFDNSITCASVVDLMLGDTLPSNVVVAFTGDEECGSVGAKDLVAFMKKQQKKCYVIVLDVTDMGWDEGADFTVENNFWNKSLGTAVIDAVDSNNAGWRFVPSDPSNIPDFVPKEKTIFVEAEGDESWEYDELGIKCFSLCLPICGEMHSDRGVLARKRSFEIYGNVLKNIANAIALKEENL